MSETARRDTLAGIRVLDFSNFVAGPFCGRLLADAGAEVVKIETFAGDMVRQRAPFRGGMSTYFAQLNCGKQSVVLDLKTPGGRDAARALAAKADVIVENFKPGVMRRLGLGYPELSALNPRLIYCAISGFGQKGPEAERPAYAPVIHALSGFDLAQREYQGAERPAKTGLYVADVLGAVHSYSAILLALRERDATGRGQSIDFALMDAMLGMMVLEMQMAQFPLDTPRLLYVPLRARDGFVMIAAISPKNLAALAHAIGMPELADDPRFATVAARESNWDELMAIVETWTLPRSAEEVERYLLERHVPCARYRTVAEAMADPQIADRGSLARLGTPGADYLVANPPYQMSVSKTEARSNVPRPGEDGAAILRDWLGWDEARVEALREAKALR